MKLIDIQFPHIDEEYKVVTYPKVQSNRYYISSYGRVYDTKKEKFLNRILDKDGYYQVSLMSYECKNNKFKQIPIKVHRLVAWEYVCGCDDTHSIVNHLDSNITNNHYSNLEWTTISGNTQHGYDFGNGKKGNSHYKNKYSESLVTEIIMYFINGYDIKDICNIYSITKKSNPKLYNLIRDIKRKKVWKWLIQEIEKREGSTTIENEKKDLYEIKITFS